MDEKAKLEEMVRSWSDDELLRWLEVKVQGRSDPTCTVCGMTKAVVKEIKRRMDGDAGAVEDQGLSGPGDK